MIVCEKCQTETKRQWTCKCRDNLNDVKMEVLQPFISQIKGWSNFLKFVQVKMEETFNPQPKTVEVILPDDFEPNLDLMIRNHILRVVHLHRGNKTRAAKDLDISVKTIYNRLEAWGLHIPEEEDDTVH
jgi:transcriptional regulator with PAS, ATPase and Fis domain